MSHAQNLVLCFLDQEKSWNKINKTLFITTIPQNTFQNPPSIDTNFRPPNVQYILQFIRLRVQFSCTHYIFGVSFFFIVEPVDNKWKNKRGKTNPPLNYLPLFQHTHTNTIIGWDASACAIRFVNKQWN